MSIESNPNSPCMHHFLACGMHFLQQFGEFGRVSEGMCPGLTALMPRAVR